MYRGANTAGASAPLQLKILLSCNIFGSPVWNLLQVTLLAARDFEVVPRLLDFCLRSYMYM
jgi:hypothetical protein